MKQSISRRVWTVVGAVLVIGVALALERAGVINLDDLRGETPGATTPRSGAEAPPRRDPPPRAEAPRATDEGAEALAAAFRDGRSGIMVEVGGVVDRILPDDDEGSPHQRFIVRVQGGQTVLVAHNLDLAQRVPLRADDDVRIRGQYEWNDRGGVLHWTHDDDRGRRQGGWIDHDGRRYR